MTFHRNTFCQQKSQRGATTVESTIVLAVFVVLLFGLLELSVAIVRYTALSEAARRVARTAIVHGSMASAAQGSWGPATINDTAASNHGAAVEARKALPTMDADGVNIHIQWLDGGNEPDSRVRVRISYMHKPIVSIGSWYDQLLLEAVSTMRIAH